MITTCHWELTRTSYPAVAPVSAALLRPLRGHLPLVLLTFGLSSFLTQHAQSDESGPQAWPPPALRGRGRERWCWRRSPGRGVADEHGEVDPPVEGAAAGTGGCVDRLAGASAAQHEAVGVDALDGDEVCGDNAGAREGDRLAFLERGALAFVAVGGDLGMAIVYQVELDRTIASLKGESAPTAKKEASRQGRD